MILNYKLNKMTELATPTDYTKEYLPGYTGHVPSKNERFGATAG